MEASLSGEKMGLPADQEFDTNASAASPEEYLGQVVVGLIESGDGQASIKHIIYALTLEATVPDDLFEDITDELKTIEKGGEIINVGNGKYRLNNGGSENGRSPETPTRNGKHTKKPTKEDRAELDKMIAAEFGGPAKPVRRRRRQLNTRMRHRYDRPSKRRL